MKYLIVFLIVLFASVAYAACPLPVDHWDYCKECGPCSVGQGDCDTDDECAAGSFCDNMSADGTETPGLDVCASLNDPLNTDLSCPSNQVMKVRIWCE